MRRCHVPRRTSRLLCRKDRHCSSLKSLHTLRWCTNPDVCTSGVCGGTSRNCNDGLFCTVNERCDEAHDTCAYDQRDCSGNNRPPIATCFNIPDNKPFTWDYAAGFTSTCNEVHDTCTQGNQTITHECSIKQCG